MSTNSPQMTLEERIVQTIKNDTLMALVGDEDAITELTKRAIREALYQPQRLPRQYGGYDDTDSIAVAAARGVAKQATERVAKEVVDALVADPEFRRKLQEAIAQSLPNAIYEQCRGMVTTVVTGAKVEAVNDIVTMVRNKSIPGL